MPSYGGGISRVFCQSNVFPLNCLLSLRKPPQLVRGLQQTGPSARSLRLCTFVACARMCAASRNIHFQATRSEGARFWHTSAELQKRKLGAAPTGNEQKSVLVCVSVCVCGLV